MFSFVQVDAVDGNAQLAEFRLFLQAVDVFEAPFRSVVGPANIEANIRHPADEARIRHHGDGCRVQYNQVVVCFQFFDKRFQGGSCYQLRGVGRKASP